MRSDPEPRGSIQQKNAIIGLLVAIVAVLGIILLVQSCDDGTQSTTTQQTATAPVEEAPEEEPAEEAPVEEAPEEELAEEAPVEEAPEEELAEEAPVEEAPEEEPSEESVEEEEEEPDEEEPSEELPVEEDSGPPEPPVNVLCLPGVNESEFSLQWDAPAEPDDVFGINVYISENGGAYNRVVQELVSEGSVLTDLPRPIGSDPNIYSENRWGIIAVSVPVGTPLMIAITSFDDDYSESGWWPIDAYYGSGADCFTGPPDAPNIGTVSPGAGSGETNIQILPNEYDQAPAEDIVSYTVLVDTGSGFQEVPIISQNFESSLNGYLLTISPNDHAPADYQITATDAHGNVSAVATRSCPDSSVPECNE